MMSVMKPDTWKGQAAAFGPTSVRPVAIPARQPWWPRFSFLASAMIALAWADCVAERVGKLPPPPLAPATQH